MPKSARALPRLLPLALLLALGACGGGGGGVDVRPPPPDPAPAGIAGHVLQEDFDLGLVAEQEPNDALGQPHRIPPLAARTRLAVTGELGASDTHFGREDPVDAFAVQVLERQDIGLTLAYADTDPVGGGANDLRVDVYEDGDPTPIASTSPGAAPRTTAFTAVPASLYRIVVRAASGHAPYTLAFELTDPAVALTEEPPVVASLSAAPASDGAPASASCADTHLLVRLRPGADAEAFAGRFGLRVGRRLASGAFRLRFPERLGRERVARLRAWCERLCEDGDVEVVEPDYIVRTQGLPNDPELARQWNLRAIGAPAAWEITRGDPSVVVGVVDSGIIEHPDLEGRVAPGYDFVSDLEIAGDGDGRDDDPTDVGAREDPSGRSWWHGTHVAAIIAARADDGYGIAGVAPGCRVMPLRAVGRGGGLVSDVVDAILFAAGLHTTEDGRRLTTPLPIVNLSFGLDVDSSELRTACDRARNVGVFLVGATGNTGLSVLYPARYDSVFAVSAVDARLDTLAYSSFGDEVDLAAPGGSRTMDAGAAGWPNAILSCQRDETVHPVAPFHGYMEGTSQAAPHVAGAAALLLSVKRDLSVRDIETYLEGSALDRGVAGRDETYGWGVLQTAGALNLLLLDLGTPWEAPPALGLVSTTDAFHGFQTDHRLPVFNVGGGKLDLAESGFPVATDDGGDWLEGRAVLGFVNGSRTNARAIEILVNRYALPSGTGVSSGTVFVDDVAGKRLGTVRVVVYHGSRLAAGQDLRVRVWEADRSSISAYGIAAADVGYRFYFPTLPAGDYQLQAGQDLDGDGFFCEKGDACGWYGGFLEEDALTISRERNDRNDDVDIPIR